MRILLSRTDNIGDVIFTLPMAGLIKREMKELYPDVKVLFLGTQYTQSIIECCNHIDEFYDWNEIKKRSPSEICKIFKDINCDAIIHIFPNKSIAKAAKEAGIKIRIGTNRRIYHWFYCNKKVNLTRKNSLLHETQLNLKLLEPLNINTDVNKNEIHKLYGLDPVGKGIKPQDDIQLPQYDKLNLILHPKSKGSAQEWDAQNFVTLIHSLSKERFNIFITGTKEEENFIYNNIISKCDNLTNLCGHFSLKEFIAFINTCDGLIAASTGPLHIAAALGKHALGLYPPHQNINVTRWGPLGENAQCLEGKNSVQDISPLAVQEIIEKWS